MIATMTWRFGRRNEFADAIRQIERKAGATRGRARTVCGSLFTILLFGTLLLVSSVATSAADMRGDQFITMMDGNTLSGTDAAGSPFSLYFLPGGQATYTGRAGSDIQGAWKLDKDGDVCVRWSPRVEPVTGCFVVTTRGDKVTWRSKRRRGVVVETVLKARTIDPRGHESASR
jgi:hypothetical protein